MDDPTLALDPPETTAPPPPIAFPPSVRRSKSKVPARRVYGDEIEQTYAIPTPGGEPVTGVCYPHVGEWVEFVGSMTLQAYMDSLEANSLRGREIELRATMERFRASAERAGGGTPSAADQKIMDEASAELQQVAVQVGGMMKKTVQALTERISRLAWTDSKGQPIGTPTGEHDDQGNAICTVSVDDIGRLEVGDLNWMVDQSLGEMRDVARGKDSPDSSDT